MTIYRPHYSQHQPGIVIGYHQEDEMTDTLDRRLINWLTSGDTGISSKTIAHVLGETPPPQYGPDIPADPSDFGRCSRLLKAFPEWRARLPEVAARYPKWSPLVEHWDELEAMYQNVVRGGGWNMKHAVPMYDRMRELEGR